MHFTSTLNLIGTQLAANNGTSWGESSANTPWSLTRRSESCKKGGGDLKEDAVEDDDAAYIDRCEDLNFQLGLSV